LKNVVTTQRKGATQLALNNKMSSLPYTSAVQLIMQLTGSADRIALPDRHFPGIFQPAHIIKREKVRAVSKSTQKALKNLRRKNIVCFIIIAFIVV
jgi:hypothetical protein